MLKIPDEQQRLRALDPTASFIVQAPAGSGKTELLTQRFLVLLSTVKQPEEILSITFTKKSAAEMRTRILNALQNAEQNPEPEAAHAKKTWQLAKNVLQQDKKLQWNLLTSPNRLRIQTIDSFNASLTRQLPILSNFGATPDITDDAMPLYQQAVQEFLQHLEEDYHWSEAIAVILRHMDNDLSKVESLLINLLSKRDQWLRHMTHQEDNIALRQKLEQHLADVVMDILQRLQAEFPISYQQELIDILHFAAEQVAIENPASPLTRCANLDALPDTTTNNIPDWLAIREFLFTNDNTWRKALTKNNGIPAAKAHPAAAAMKSRALALIETLSQQTNLQELFKELSNAPSPNYKEEQWQTLSALHATLRIVVAQLKVTFQQHGKIDYTENALAALTALGSDETPTDLTLALDYQIKHILVDEFQDTSNSQYALLKKITAGWEPQDGRTLFLVGDPMQSIYRFREAEVGLFIRTRQRGLGNVVLEPLTLSVNFRSTAGVVNWVNAHFPQVFPAIDDVTTGAVSYSPSLAAKQDASHAVTLHPFVDGDKTDQAQAIVELIQQRQKTHPDDTIAILVRSRPQLSDIIPALKKAGLLYRAIKIDPLTERPFIQDLMALTRALFNPADRIAWLSILRAPWCGLTLSDLLLLSGKDSRITLWERLQSPAVIATLSHAGQQRIARLLTVMQSKVPERQRFSLRAWVESTWLLLGGAACIEQAADLEDTAAYFALLDKLEQSSQILTLDLLADYVNQLYAAPDNRASDKLQIMTIHNAKGLEFDTVILPHLEAKPSRDQQQLLLWMERPRDDDTYSLILAPVHAIGHETDAIYEYIKTENARKNDYEQGRLLYVAVTRAKKHLELFFSLKENESIPANSLLKKLWPAIQNQIDLPEATLTVKQDKEEHERKPLRRLPVEWRNPVQENRLADTIYYHQKQTGFLLPDSTAQHIGTVTHQILQQISQQGIRWWQMHPAQQDYLRNQLLRLGVLTRELDTAIKKVSQAIERTLKDPRGQWILAAHQDTQTEWPLTAIIDYEVTQLVIDRTFVDENDVRWIIDYKTSSVTNEMTLNDFLLSEQQKYQQKMWHYFQAIKQIDQRPIRMGLYFPLIPAWHEWEGV